MNDWLAHSGFGSFARNTQDLLRTQTASSSYASFVPIPISAPYQHTASRLRLNKSLESRAESTGVRKATSYEIGGLLPLRFATWLLLAPEPFGTYAI